MLTLVTQSSTCQPASQPPFLHTATDFGRRSILSFRLGCLFGCLLGCLPARHHTSHYKPPGGTALTDGRPMSRSTNMACKPETQTAPPRYVWFTRVDRLLHLKIIIIKHIIKKTIVVTKRGHQPRLHQFFMMQRRLKKISQRKE